MNKKNYSNLDKTFNDERIDVEERFGNTLDLVYGAKNSRSKSRAVRVSISLPEDDINYVSYLRGVAIDPTIKLYPTISDIYRAGIHSLRKIEKEKGDLFKSKIIKLIRDN